MFVYSELVQNDGNYYEIFFPGKHTQLNDDGLQISENGWAKLSSETLKNAYPLYKENGEQVTIPIDYVLHATHAGAAAKIRPKKDDGEYTFKPHTKCGKKYNDVVEGSYVKVGDNAFQKIWPRQSVLQGKLSWWSPVISPWQHSTDQYRASIWKAAHALKTSHCYLAQYLSFDAESRSGDRGFVVPLKNLLNFYKESRTDIDKDEERVVYMRIGGTLRYRYEICHVVIVCTKRDQELKANYPSLHYSEVFDHKGIVLKSGQIKSDFFDSDKSIGVKPQHSVKWVPVSGSKHSCYEVPAFAFYYPQESDDLTLNCTGVDEVFVKHECSKQCDEQIQKSLQSIPTFQELFGSN